MSDESSQKKPMGLAIIGCGKIGRIRAELAKDYPGVEWLGLCDINEKFGKQLAADTEADFFTTDYKELLARPEVNSAIIATEENEHFGPVMASVEQGHDLFIEKPLATNAMESAEILKAIEGEGIDAVVGYTQRFRRKFLVVKEKLRNEALGDVTTVTTRAFMNRLVPIATVEKTEQRGKLTPMVVSGTHSLDICMWLLEGKKPVEVYARSVDRALGASYGTKDATTGIFTFEDGTIWSMSISWALPVVWPGSVYSLEIGIVGTEGVLTIDDTHRDMVLASERAQPAGYTPEITRNVDFLTSYPPGDIAFGQLWGPMREETNAWYQRVHVGLDTPHATAADGHRNLMMTMAMDLSAKRGKAIKLPVDPAELLAELG
ncbi:MAG: Gfo/Idh/MocA family oxidoreductase [Nitrospinaceae bacterium]|jgi:myo-inositol 2-dehydrogenase / D-chiro-inositol 1-dehydrogenase|nr:Gfo/Idh/MocA family oxidoreductase [Nitrospinaceae bacterium]MBT3433003.1 Gfo/Idh/MocA family oxidoreductase [Nitrospinaceae bacterium]MBT4093852.1 Gfo/Idh/MocA family oxidoreductase [Nitrospinaceae bacterium]MBT4430126.1 Gfo/Idh/MocA family oxidoreductase [Nitrospinaceae bacterium]MBT5367646.1 Gfo/Idh/MocA family oxidoreductase [Nitrospinaceae bacterium]